MISNNELQKHVEDALLWEPLLKSSKITVLAKEGMITLSGLVDNYTKKLATETEA